MRKGVDGFALPGLSDEKLNEVQVADSNDPPSFLGDAVERNDKALALSRKPRTAHS